jgi:hypothetical protein
MAKVDEQIVKVGDFVGFKSDTEQYGTVTAIEGDWLVLRAACSSGFDGGYIGGQMQTRVDSARCWLD